MFVLIRALTYSSLFIALLLVFLPAQLLTRYGIPSPARFGWPQIVGGGLSVLGAAMAIGCILTFVVVGRGTPAPFDPPRKLVVRGPYAILRNPMYVGAGLALIGAASFYESLVLAAYAAAFLVAMHLLVILYEEPVLRRTFGADYAAYCQRVGRWWPF